MISPLSKKERNSKERPATEYGSHPEQTTKLGNINNTKLVEQI